MKISAWLTAAIVGAGAMFVAGCATAPAETGDLVYYDDGYGWWWCEGVGWCYVGFYGHGRPTEIALHRPPGHGEHPRPGAPGHPPPCFYFLGKGGRVLASEDGRSFRQAGTTVDGHFVPQVPQRLETSWELAEFGHGRVAGGGVAAGGFAARPLAGFQRFVTNTANSFSHPGSNWNHGSSAGRSFSGGGGRYSGGYSGGGRSSGGGWSRGSAASSGGGGWSRGGGGGGGWSGGGRGGGGGGGGSRGGGGGGGGGGHRDH